MIKRKKKVAKKKIKRAKLVYSNRKLSFKEFCAFQNNFHLILIGGQSYSTVLRSAGLSLRSIKQHMPTEFAVVKKAWKERVVSNKKIAADREARFGDKLLSEFSEVDLKAYAKAVGKSRNAFYQKAQTALYSLYCFLKQNGLSNNQLLLDPQFLLKKKNQKH